MSYEKGATYSADTQDVWWLMDKARQSGATSFEFSYKGRTVSVTWPTSRATPHLPGLGPIATENA